jgi:hypothetical protein
VYERRLIARRARGLCGHGQSAGNRGGETVPYLVETEKNCFRCVNLAASDAGYICKLGFGKAQTIWTGHLALICPHFEERSERQQNEDEEY